MKAEPSFSRGENEKVGALSSIDSPTPWALVVKWISRLPSEQSLGVRIPPGAPSFGRLRINFILLKLALRSPADGGTTNGGR